jgi:hypothetical protein
LFKDLKNISFNELSFNNVSTYLKTSLKCKLRMGRFPDFFILGAQKAGTTSLFRYINEFADNFISPARKELYFFTEKYERGINWYKAYFPNKKKNNITGEASPSYLFYHKAPERIVQYIPKAKFIILLRNPIDRAYSQYQHQNNTNKTKAYDPLPFHRAIQKDIKRFENKYYLKSKKFNYIYKYFSYVSRGIYSTQIQRWLDYFPREKFLFIKSNDLFNNTEDELNKVFDFLGLKFKNKTNFNFKKYNKNNYNEMSKETRKLLRKFYKPYNENLSKIIDMEIDWE